MNTSSIALVDLNLGEALNITGNMPNTKFLQRGYKMYNNGVIALIDILTKEEIKRTINLFDSKYIDYNNIFNRSFLKLTLDMSKAARSRYKRKLLTNSIMQEYHNKLMLNPYIFIPRGDKNISNSQHLTQRVWKYLFEDMNTYSEIIEEHATHLFGAPNGPKHIYVGNKNFSKLIEVPNDTK